MDMSQIIELPDYSDFNLRFLTSAQQLEKSYYTDRDIQKPLCDPYRSLVLGAGSTQYPHV